MPGYLQFANKAAIPVVLGVAAFCWASPAAAQARVEKNVIYGMYSGLALLMDVHRPEKHPTGLGSSSSRAAGGAPGPGIERRRSRTSRLATGVRRCLAPVTRCSPSITAPRRASTTQIPLRTCNARCGSSGITRRSMGSIRRSWAGWGDRRAAISLAWWQCSARTATRATRTR